jgi:hypothetical protein
MKSPHLLLIGLLAPSICSASPQSVTDVQSTVQRITSGLPVGLKADDGKTYLLVGEHKPLNSELAQYAAKKITVEGKVASRDGIYMIENAVIQK